MSKKAESAAKTDAVNESSVATKQTLGQKLEAEKRQNKERRQKARQAAKVRGKKRLIYSGPYIPGGALITGGIYMEIPETLKDTIDKLPELKELFVEDKDYPDFKNSLVIQGSEPYRLYHYVAQSIRKGVLKNGSK